MKRLTKIKKAKILKWEDIPLGDAQLKRLKVKDETKYFCLYGGSNTISNEPKEKLINLLKTDGPISLEISTDYDGYVEEIEFIAGENFNRDETDEEYNLRMDYIKKSEFEELIRSRKIEKANETKRKNISKHKDEYDLFLKLKKKFEN